MASLDCRIVIDASAFMRDMRSALLAVWDIQYAEAYNKATARVVTAR